MSALKALTVTEDGFVFNPTTGESYTLNRCAQLILQRLQQGETRQQIAVFLSSRFGISDSAAQRDVSEFCGQLSALGLVTL